MSCKGRTATAAPNCIFLVEGYSGSGTLNKNFSSQISIITFSRHVQKSSSAPPSSSSQSTASKACSPSACNLSNPVKLSRNPVSLNAFNNIGNPCVSYALRTCHTKVSHKIWSASRSQLAHRLAAPCATVIRRANDPHVVELRKKPTKLVRNESQ